MRCPSCSAEVPDRDLVCGDCGAYVYRNVPPAPREPSIGEADSGPGRPTVPQPGSAGMRQGTERNFWGEYPRGSGGPDYIYPTLQGWPGLAPDDTSGIDAAGENITSQADEVRTSILLMAPNEAEMRRRGRTMGRWSIGLALLSLLIPLAGPVGIVTGYLAWRLGETRLGRIGVLTSVVAMVTGVTVAILLAPTNGG